MTVPRAKRSFGFWALPPWADKSTLNVVIETPKGSRNKFAFDPERRVLELKKVLPAGMSFPYDFGFVPSTRAGDGDPIDALVLMDQPAFPGCVLGCRLIGVIEGEITGGEEAERNDRLVGVEIHNHSFETATHLSDLGDGFVRELEAFFVNYHALDDRQDQVLGVRGREVARRHVREASPKRHR